MPNEDLIANVTEVAGRKVLPPCVLLDRLGGGGMGAVYRAHHLNLAIDVAVKVLRPSLVADDPQFVARFKREGQAAAAINHQNVIRVFDVAEHGGLHYIIMELVVGETARQRVVRKGPLPVAEALQILRDAAMGLGAAHALGTVHRDVKPDNLLVANSGQVKVADLGLAKPMRGGSGVSLMSAANQVMGTPAYMPPEQWESPAVGPAADVWALGATLWFLLAGEDAFDCSDGNYPRVMKQIVLQTFPDLRKLRSDVPEPVLAMLAKATAKEPSERYADAAELAAAIEQLAWQRGSLRDLGERAEARTMVSPHLRDLDKIKQWLREDNVTRQQTPRPPASGAGVATAGTPPAATTEPRPGPPTVAGPTTGLPKRAARMGRRMLAIAATLLVAGGGAAWALGGGDEDPGVQQLKEFEEQKQFAKAIVLLQQLFDKKVVPRDNPRLAGLRVQNARSLEGEKKWQQALAEMQEAVNLDGGTVAEQAGLRTRAVAAAKAVLVVEPSPVPRSVDKTGFVVTLPFDAVVKVRAGGTELQRRDVSSFRGPVLVQGNDVPIEVELTDGHVAQLMVLAVTETVAPRQLAFSNPLAPADGLVETYALTKKDTIRLTGKVNEPGVELFDGERKLQPEFKQDGSFTVDVPVDREGEEREITITARKKDFTEATSSLRVVRLGKVPPFTLSAPTNGAEIEALMVRVEVTDLSKWTRSVVATCGTQRVSLERRGETTTYAGSIVIVGANSLAVEVGVLGGIVDMRSVPITCTYKPAAITAVELVTGTTRTALAQDVRNFVNRTTSRVEVVLAGTAPRLRRGGVDCTTTTIDLSKAREGEPIVLALEAGNELPARASWNGTIVIDTTKPEITVDSPAADATFAPGQAIALRGTWKDAGGCREILVGDAEAELTRAGDGAGTWAFTLKGGLRESATLRIRARDAAGNEAEREQRIAIDANAGAKVAKAFTDAGFQIVADAGVDELGYPKRIVDTATGIELVAVGAKGGKPARYVGKTTVTERQFDGAGSGSTKRVSARDVSTWLDGKKLADGTRRFDLLKREELQADQVIPELSSLKTGGREWLRPDSWTGATWPICKEEGRETLKTTDPAAFRVVFRPR